MDYIYDEYCDICHGNCCHNGLPDRDTINIDPAFQEAVKETPDNDKA